MTTRSARGIELIAHHDLGGAGDGMQVMRYEDTLFVGHHGPSGKSTSILDVTDLSNPRLVAQWEAPPGTHCHKVQVAGGYLLVNQERFGDATSFTAGMLVFGLADPRAPELLGRFDCGGAGVHRIVYVGGDYAYVSATPDGFGDRIWLIVDLSDPSSPREAGRWWWPGEWPAGKRYAAHHALLDGSIAYLGYGDAGMVVLDVGDVSNPRFVTSLQWTPGGDTHTCLPLPGRKLVVATDEAIRPRCNEERKLVHVVDVSDNERPHVVSTCPEPMGNYCEMGLRFGPHNLHENRPGSYRSENLVFVTYFNAGLRVYDISDAARPVEIAHWEPDPPPGQEAPQINDLFVDDDCNVFVTDRITGGLYILQSNAELRGRMESERV
jgi:hypothetical protein